MRGKPFIDMVLDTVEETVRHLSADQSRRGITDLRAPKVTLDLRKVKKININVVPED